MARVPSFSPRQVGSRLSAGGFQPVESEGSHRQFVKGDRIVTVPMHAREISIGLLMRIIQQSGLPQSHFLRGVRKA